VETNPFLRAQKYLSYAGAARWFAILAAIGSSILYVVLIIVLALFFDLLVTHGRIPQYSVLSPQEQTEFANRWQELSDEDRTAAVQQLGVTEKRQLEIFAGKELPPVLGMGSEADWVEWAKKRKVDDNLPLVAVNDMEVRWRAYVWHFFNEQVSADAAMNYQPRLEAGENPLKYSPWSGANRTGYGILATVLNQRNSLSGKMLGWIASWSPWMWQPTDANDANQRYLTGLLFVAILLVTLRSLLVMTMNWQASKAAVEASTRLRRAIYHHTARLGNLGIRSQKKDDQHELFSVHVENIHEALKAYLTHVYRYPLQFFLCLGVAFLASPLLALIFLLFGSLVWIMGGQLTAAFQRQSQRAFARLTNRQTQLVESVSMMRLVKAYLMELFNQSRIERQLADYLEANQMRTRGETFARPVFFLLAMLGAVALLYLAGRLILADGTDMVNLLLLLIAFGSLYSPITARFEYRRLLRRAKDSSQQVFEFLDRKGDLAQYADAEFLQPMSKSIEFVDVSVREPGTTHMLLRNVNLTIPAGKKIALVGGDENEKLAFVSLLPRFFDPSAGEVKIDGRNLKWVTSDSLRAQIGMVVQENLIFNDTVRNNIGCGEPGYSLPQIVEAAKLAHAHQFIQKLPHGYETLIGELGHELSPVEQFQIGLARALLRDPAILVIQEPQHALNEDGKILIDDTLHRFLGNRTVIYLAHRVSTLRHCDEVILLNEGRIEAIGQHRELLKNNPRYQHLYYLEFNVFAEQQAG
jgi:ABC-type multidrug transport system fused ATPase/permease subunit